MPVWSNSGDVAELKDGNGVLAVSYTHLRAHETVLDLVCRLLLEKKKKKHTYSGQQLTNSTYDNDIYEHISKMT